MKPAAKIAATMVALLALAAVAPARAVGQIENLAQLPDSVASRVVAFYNDPGTIRLSGEGHVAAGSTIRGAVAVLGGPFSVAGSIEGDLVVINGDLRLEPGARVTGSITVVGGAFDGRDQAVIGGAVVHYSESLTFRHDAGGLTYTPAGPEPELSAGREFGFGRTDVLVAARGDYNRVEGLPVSVGPRVRIGRSNPTLLEAFAVYRSSAGLRIDLDQIGYAVRAEQFIGGGNTARIGFRLYSEIAAIEGQGLSNNENSLATFVLHDDFRDRFEREGWSAYMRFARSGWPHDLTLEYREERHRSVAAGSPWSLFDNADPWRPQPVVAEGTWRGVGARFVYDTRNDDRDPAAGWHIVIDAEQGTGGNLRRPMVTALPPDTGTAGPFSVRERYTAATFDIRRYMRIGPDSRLALRAFLAGSPDGSALPPQRQHTLGGEGGLAGYSLNQFDCAARRTRVSFSDTAYYAWYGCDRVALAQIEVQGSFPFLSRTAEPVGRALGIQNEVRWVVFFDAGRAWNEPDEVGDRSAGQSRFATDAGFGIRIGGLGAYLAAPLSGSDHSPNFFVRLSRRL